MLLIISHGGSLKSRLIRHRGNSFECSIEQTGQDAGGGVAGRSRRVLVTIGRKRLPFVEKIFKAGFEGLYPRSVFILGELKKLKLSVPPRFMLSERGSIIMTDLSEGGKFKVVDYVNPGGLNPQVHTLRNFNDIVHQMNEEGTKAAKHGFNLNAKNWLVVIDSEKNIGRPYIVDTKEVNMVSETQKKFLQWKEGLSNRDWFSI
ncbi:MAG: hypothetical protein V1676_07465 [Candidatus Diapherotrites archaeon]